MPQNFCPSDLDWYLHLGGIGQFAKSSQIPQLFPAEMWLPRSSTLVEHHGRYSVMWLKSKVHEWYVLFLRVNGNWHGRFAIPIPAVLLVLHSKILN